MDPAAAKNPKARTGHTRTVHWLVSSGGMVGIRGERKAQVRIGGLTLLYAADSAGVHV